MLILDGRLSADNWPLPQSAYQEQAIAFARAWQSGQQSFVLHTSGSTGTPKPITLSRSQMQASAEVTGRTFGLESGDTALCCLNVGYVAGTMMLVRALTLGLQLTIVEPAGNPLAELGADRPSFAFMAFVPLQIQTILEQTPDRLAMLNGARAILLGGAATSPALDAQLRVIEAPVFATYGMTETVSHVAIRRLNGPASTDYFSALAGVELGVDERGCLNIRAAATDWQLVQTNDVIEWVDDAVRQQFRLLGRADSIINTGGVKVQPERVERLIQQVMASAGQNLRLFVAGLPDDRLGQRLVLIVEGDEAQRPVIESVQEKWREQIRREIGPYAVPKAVIFAPTFRETPTGKIDRRATILSVYGS